MQHLTNYIETCPPSEVECFRAGIVGVLPPPPDLMVSEWADCYRQLSSESSAEPGQWVTSRAEYQRGMLDALCDPAIETVVVMSSAQVGKTEILLNAIGYYISQDPAPILCLQPTLDMAKTFSKDRLAPMARDTPALSSKLQDPRSRDGDNTMFHKKFPGGHITMAGANSPASLASRPIRIVLCDEVDRYPVSAGAEGDPVNLARKRATTFWNRKIILTSTPTVKGASRIEAAYDASDKRRYFVPCPHCNEFQTLKFGGKDEAYGLKWEDGAESVGYMCEVCGEIIREHDRLRMIAKGEWRITGKVGTTAGFHINELCSPWVPWRQVVIDFLDAKKSPETLQVWINTALGETYEEKGEGVSGHKLAERQESYSADDMPEGVVFITAGCDVQGDRLEMEIVGWGIGEESWSLDYVVLNGEPAHHVVWDALDAELMRRFKHPRYGDMGMSVLFVDAGYMTDRVNAYVKDRVGVYAIKGVSSQTGVATPIVPPEFLNPTKKRRSKGKQINIGTDAAKDLIYKRLQFAKPGPGYCHFPDFYPPEYFDGLTAEQKRVKYLHNRPVKYWFLPKNARNEPLDCRVYALAALRFMAKDLARRKDVLEKKRALSRKPPVKKTPRTLKTPLW